VLSRRNRGYDAGLKVDANRGWHMSCHYQPRNSSADEVGRGQMDEASKGNR
jgi:hypothetical protein